MQLTALLGSAALLATAQAKIAFTQVPGSSVSVGKSFTIKWDGAEDDAPVTITLKQGDPDDLTTVALLTGNAQGGSYTWTPSSSLVNGDNYALEISQGTGFDETNYSGEFAITGGSASSSAAASSTAAASSGASMTVTMTSGNSTFITSHSMYPAATGTGTGASHSAKTTSPSGSGNTVGIVATATSTVTNANGPSSTGSAHSPSSSAGAAHIGPVGGVAAFFLGLAALL